MNGFRKKCCFTYEIRIPSAQIPPINIFEGNFVCSTCIESEIRIAYTYTKRKRCRCPRIRNVKHIKLWPNWWTIWTIVNGKEDFFLSLNHISTVQSTDMYIVIVWCAERNHCNRVWFDFETRERRFPMFLVGEIRKFVNLGHSFSSVQAHYIGLYAQYIAEQLNGKCYYREKERVAERTTFHSMIWFFEWKWMITRLRCNTQHK